MKTKKIILSFLFSFAVFLFLPRTAFASITTLYFGPFEKTYDDFGNTVETKINYSTVNAALSKTIRPDGSSEMVYLHPDFLGSNVLVTDKDGNSLASSVYLPYGDEFENHSSASTADYTDRQYTSQRKDTSSNLYFYNSRYYNPRTGRFISADKAEGPNRYAYVGNNPIMKNDPSGNCPNCIAGAVGFVGGFVFGTIVDIGMQAVINKGDISLSRALTNGVVTGTYSGCVGLTAGVGVGACAVIASTLSITINATINVTQNEMELGDAVGSAVLEEGISLATGHVMGVLGREVAQAAKPAVKQAIRPVVNRVTNTVRGEVVGPVTAKIMQRAHSEGIGVRFLKYLGIVNSPGHPGYGHEVLGLADISGRQIFVHSDPPGGHHLAMAHEVAHVEQNAAHQRYYQVMLQRGYPPDRAIQLAAARAEGIAQYHSVGVLQWAGAAAEDVSAAYQGFLSYRAHYERLK